MLLSIVICTRNRPQSLERTLYSMVESARDCDFDEFEVLVIDNGDSLDTSAISAKFCSHLPLRIVSEKRPGLSIARNSGVAFAQGEWILWTDDDVTVDALWLKAYCAAIKRFPNVSVMGGPITPTFDGQPPSWLLNGQHHIPAAFASRAPEDVTDVFQKGGPTPYGANFAIRRSDALRFPFDTSLGRHPQRPTRGGEETMVIQNILSDGGTGRWLRDATVLHHIDQSRQSRKYIRSFYFDIGFSHIMLRSLEMRRRIAIINFSKALYGALRNEIRYMAARTVPAQPNLVLYLKHAAKSWGAVNAWLILIFPDVPTVTGGRTGGG